MRNEKYYMYLLSGVSVICISIITISALLMGIDSLLYKTGIGAIFGIASGLGGYLYGRRIKNGS